MKNIKSMIYARICIGLVFLIISGCDSKPNETQCKVALANFLRLQMSPQMTHTQINKTIESDPVSKKMIQMCMKTKPVKQVKCEMSASSLDELKNCKNLTR